MADDPGQPSTQMPWPLRIWPLAVMTVAVTTALVLRAALEAAGFRLVIREPWWYGHRLLAADEPSCNLHVFGFDSPELVRHRIFRDWLRDNPGERDRSAAAKRRAASEANAAGEHVMQYNARKQQVIREIYHRAFAAAGLLEP
jgi:GrpB-like predicted nucleotidyltransferase (UPF0157 family)